MSHPHSYLDLPVVDHLYIYTAERQVGAGLCFYSKGIMQDYG